MYLIRLDDASEFMDIKKWSEIEKIFDKYNIKPIVGVIPNNQDLSLVSRYNKDNYFWDKVRDWQKKGWTIALHGYSHVYETNSGGLNPINFRSEFAGVDLEIQKEKISKGIAILKKNEISTKIFFAPAHTFDKNTLTALKDSSDIRIISDTIANNVYKKDDFYFIPQQSGKVRNLPFKLTTFCYHPNEMTPIEYLILEEFIKNNVDKFGSFLDIDFIERNEKTYDKLIRILYFKIRSLKTKMRG